MMRTINGLHHGGCLGRTLVTAAAVLSCTSVGVASEHDHGDDHGEHMAVLDLVPHDAVTHMAMHSGDWSDPGTWMGGMLPGADARVHIPEGVEVEFDLPASPRLMNIRVDGTLELSSESSTNLFLRTMVITPTGSFVAGSPDRPVPDGVNAFVFFRSDVPVEIDDPNDPLQLGLGVISLGRVELYGQMREAFTTLAEPSVAGDSVLILDGQAGNWDVGHKIIVAGTEYLRPANRQNSGTQDEVRMITGIERVPDDDVTIVTLNQPLEYDRVPPPQAVDWYEPKSHVANRSRNIMFQSELGPSSPINKRAHMMIMSSDSVFEGVAWCSLGRTDKSVWVDDPGMNPGGWMGEGTNARGRYPLHFHKIGTDSVLSDPVQVRGCFMQFSPGWGYVLHSSHGVFEDNVSYHIYGAAYVTEIGDELGAFRRNISMHTHGRWGNVPKNGNNNHDFGYLGHAFWFQGRNVICEDNVAAGSAADAFVWFHRSQGVFIPEIPTSHVLEPWGYDKHKPFFLIDDVPIAFAKGLTAYASRGGLRVIKGSPDQGHWMRNRFEDVNAWNCEVGAEMEYTAHYTVNRMFLSGTGRANRFGLRTGNTADDFVFNRLHIQHFGHGIDLDDNFRNEFHPCHAVFIDLTLVDADGDGSSIPNYNPDFHTILESATPVPAGQIQLRLDTELVCPEAYGWRDEQSLILEGTFTDSAGDAGFYHSRWRGYEIRDILREGHYVRPNGTAYILIEELIADRVTGEITRFELEVDLCNEQQLNFGPTLENQNTARSAPSTAPDDLRTTAGEVLRVGAPGLLANDVAEAEDLDDARVIATLVGKPANGSLNVNANGSFTYRPNPGFTGEDSFTYVACIDGQMSAPTTVTVAVACRIDLNADGMIDLSDAVLFINAFSSGDLTADFNDDGEIDILDLTAFTNLWFSGCE